MSIENFIHVYQDNAADKTLVLLHGTGADEYDLLPLVDTYSQKYNFLSLRGNVVEQGMNRFFARSAPGVFDRESIDTETQKLSEFIKSWCQKHNYETNQLVYLGYSNGANMILALCFLYPELVQQGILLHPMLPLKPSPLDLSGKRFLISYGHNDQIIATSESLKAISKMQSFNAEVIEVSHSGGHEIRTNELNAIREFLSS